MKKVLVLVFLVATMMVSAQSIYDIQFTTDAGNDGTYPCGNGSRASGNGKRFKYPSS